MRQTVIALFLFFLILGSTSCNSRTQKEVPQQQESDTTTVEVSNHPITDMLYAELDSAEIYNDSILYGYWFKPHEACDVNIFFHKDNTYEFKYYEVGKGGEIINKNKKGSFTFDGKVIKLTSDEGWNDYFNGVMYYKHNGTNYYLTDKGEGLYLVKGSD
jgi:hypothetical protein